MGEHDGHRERLRKKFLTHGLDALQDYEVLELILFYAVPRCNTTDTAKALLEHFGSLSAVLDAPLSELKTVFKIGENSAVLLRLLTSISRRYMLSRTEEGVCLPTTQACGEFLLPYFFGVTEEMIYLLCLDAKCKVLTCQLLQIGSLNSASLPIRKTIEITMAWNASSVVLAHNHTSGLALPSKADVDATLTLKSVLEPLEILLADHVIVADNDFVSMAENGFL